MISLSFLLFLGITKLCFRVFKISLKVFFSISRHCSSPSLPCASSKASILAWVCSILFLRVCTSSLARWRSAAVLFFSRSCLSASRNRCFSSLIDLFSSVISSAFGPRAFLSLPVNYYGLSSSSKKPPIRGMFSAKTIGLIARLTHIVLSYTLLNFISR